MAESSLVFLPFLKRQPPLPIDGSTPGRLTARLDLQILDKNNTGVRRSRFSLALFAG